MQPPIQLPGYSIGASLGKGAMATVYLGEQLSLHRAVAIKVLDAALVDDDTVQAQFQQESQLVASLNHPNIIQVIDQGVSANGQPYFVMQYVKSVNLCALLSRPDVTLPRKIDIVMQICKALSYAHRNGVVHRDIKPANILVDYDGHVRVVDFGIAGYFAQQSDEQAIMGTPAYMAPEQAEGKAVSAQADIYALGVLMHELFYGGQPGQAPAGAAVPKVLAGLVDDCLSREPLLRPKTADEVRQRLLLILQGKHLSEHRWEGEQSQEALPAGYKLLDILKENHYGATYLVSDPKRKRLLVVKKQKCAYEGDAYNINKNLTGLDHPHIARVYGTAKNQRVFISVLEYVSGGSLEERLSQAFPLAHWLLLAQQICEALSYAHSKGIVHGNLRPSNLLLYKPAQIKLSDFGYSEHSDKERDWYQPADEAKSPLSDIYSAGAVLFHLLTGQPVVIQQGGIANEQQMAILPPALQSVLKKMLALDTSQRYQNFEQVKQALLAFSNDQQTVIIRPRVVAQPEPPAAVVAARPRHKIIVGSLLLVLVVLAVLAELLWLASQGYLGEGLQQQLQALYSSWPAWLPF
ncbi:serine/threonine protein kinase [Dasania sp. GY-MA-18]|uniref:Serine/threonine-protein kinase n=1 Tax=Dasania phycosphaerae TaxID=2950436 RepID=A0A9J6RIE0_9GAMM|nr:MULTISPECIES: serine/threonine-protein kinase [Dasania]MCR8921710.1 serine/threonine protein kinase [Dasania sp. GY-MA-18]MCZ0864138.1 serine/threonine-protein kinase [Dasania phycosphaerae]MCZ0867866.1 serine/threonine-protein kinase [Dasania phycosphaerae]